MRDTLTRTRNRPLNRHSYSDTLNRFASPRGRWAVDATTPENGKLLRESDEESREILTDPDNKSGG